ncbi:MAG: polyprenyl synthetase family protein [Tepidanaerobacteraceae bacterium]|nr:polyprenyl synthetase family protein [Tepidanaerobacteraceae bacterium]
MDEFQKLLKQKAEIVDAALDFYLPREAFPKRLHQALRYSVMAGGKRIRPILVMESAKLFGLSFEKVIPTACGIEMIHTYSLIHDDLPVMDNDDLRRGKPTCHKVFGEAMALLAGDALLTDAFSIIARNSAISGISLQAVLDVIDRISKAAGSLGMVGGQAVDIDASGKDIDEQTLLYIDRHKTGCLISASLWSGARLAEASESDLKTIDDYGERIGLLFQIIDDILDINGDEKLIGKRVGSDAKNNKNTFPSLFGYDESLQMVEKLCKEAKDLISSFDNNWFFIQLIEFLKERRY